MPKTVAIDCFPESVSLYRTGYVIVAIDVIRATTTAITVVAAGRRCFVAPSMKGAFQLTRKLHRPLLVGELKGKIPHGFDMNNSPAELAVRSDILRPVVLLSSSGTGLICEAGKCEAAYLACFRNYSFAARCVRRHPRVAVIGAGSRGEFRQEDQMCCAWVAAELMKAGYEPQDRKTLEVVERWSGASPRACLKSKSVDYLAGTNQGKDLDFILAHVDDLDQAFVVRENEIIGVSSTTRNDAALFKTHAKK
jgi:2-phosphosulfolactate phosphatase